MNNNKPKFSILFCILYVTQLTQCKVGVRQGDDVGPNDEKDVKTRLDQENGSECWISLKEKNFFEKMDTLDQKYKDVREAYKREVNTNLFDKRILDAMKRTRGVAERAFQKVPNFIPSGLNLGSYCMMRVPGSVLFFYRLKLRNDTRFVVNYIHNDVDQLTLTMRLSLNDLHLLGQYERALMSREDPSRLYYRPNKGEVEFLLKDVKYKVEGRYRLLDDRLHIEHIISEIPPMQILMRYTETSGNSIPLEHTSIKDYLDKMQSDLDLWLKDYFNDFLMLYGFEEAQKNEKIQEYENERTIIQNEYADTVMEILNNRVRSLGTDLMMPNFMLTAVNGMEIKLYDGSVRGFDSMYRRSVATGKRVDGVRYLDADIGFSGLKAEYRYETYVKTGLPPVSGVFVLNADDISAHMALQVVNYKPSTADLQVTYLRHGKPESLTIEGPANRIVANFNHLLEHHIISIMSTTLIHHIRSLSSLTKCDPQLATKDQEERSRSDGPFNTDVKPEYDITTPVKPDDYKSYQDTDKSKETEMTQNTENDDGPTEPSQYTETDRPVNKDEPTEPSEYNNSDDAPISTPADSIDTDLPTLPSNNDDDDVPTPPSDNDDGPTVAPTSDEDDVPTAPVDEGNGQTVLPEKSDDNDPTESYTDDYVPPVSLPAYDDQPEYKADNTKDQKPDYGFARKESIELELPPKPGFAKGQSFKIDHNETFTMKKLNGKDVKPPSDHRDDDVDTRKKAYRVPIN